MFGQHPVTQLDEAAVAALDVVRAQTPVPSLWVPEPSAASYTVLAFEHNVLCHLVKRGVSVSPTSSAHPVTVCLALPGANAQQSIRRHLLAATARFCAALDRQVPRDALVDPRLDCQWGSTVDQTLVSLRVSVHPGTRHGCTQ